MSLIEKSWFRALSYVGIFFLSWILDIGSFIAFYEKIFYPSFNTMLYTDFSASLYAFLFILYFLRNKHFFSLIVPILNFFIGLILFILELLFMAVGSSF